MQSGGWLQMSQVNVLAPGTVKMEAAANHLPDYIV